MTNTTRFELSEADLPRFWYNINADSPSTSHAGAAPRNIGAYHTGFPFGAIPDGINSSGNQY